MSQDAKKPDLFKWKQITQTKPKRTTTAQGDVQHWVKRVEMAADNAVSSAFGHKQVKNNPTRNGPQPDESVYSEARNLINGWMREKHTKPYTEGLRDPSESIISEGLDIPSRYEVRKEWDHLMSELGVSHAATVARPVAVTMGTNTNEPRTRETCTSPRSRGPAECASSGSSERREERRGPQRYHRDRSERVVVESLADYQVEEEDRDDSEEVVGAIMQRLLEKDYVSRAQLRRTEEPPRVDLHQKMAARRDQVKEKREQKRRDEDAKRREAIQKREAETAARKMLLEEEKKKVAQIKKEEEMIQQEMVKIRKEMNDKKKQEEERRKKEQAEMVGLERKIAAHNQVQSEESGGSRSSRSSRSNRSNTVAQNLQQDSARQVEVMERRKRQILQLIADGDQRRVAENLQLLQRCFAGWFNLVLKRRMQLGKAVAVSNWRRLRRNFHGWRDHTRAQHIDREVRMLEMRVREDQRKMDSAEKHCRIHLLRRSFFAWKIYSVQEKEARYLAALDAEKRIKMAAFIEAAASGRLPSTRSNVSAEESQREVALSTPQQTPTEFETFSAADDQHQDTDRRLGELFSTSRQRTRHYSSDDQASNSVRSESTDRSNGPIRRTVSPAPGVRRSRVGNAKNSRKLPVRAPTEAWQVTKSHVRLPMDQILSQDPADEDHVSRDSQSCRDSSPTPRDSLSRPWLKPPKVVNNYENRHKAQQRILEEQRHRIREQERMIEELKFQQTRQSLGKEIEAQNVVLDYMNKHGPQEQAWSATREPSGLPCEIVIPDEPEVFSTSNREDDVSAVSACNSAVSRNGSSVDKPYSEQRETARAKNANTRNQAAKNAFVKKMEERAAERSRMRAEREERKRQLEDERLNRLEADLKEKEKEDEEAKQIKLKELREKRRLEKQRTEARQARVEHEREMTQLADNHRRTSLMKWNGWQPWRRLIDSAREDSRRADRHFEGQLTGRVFEAWLMLVRTKREEEDQLVHSFYTSVLIRRCFCRWKMFKHRMDLMEVGAEEWNTQNIMTKTFAAWKQKAVEGRLRERRYCKLAEEHDRWRIVWRCWKAWKMLPALAQVERDKEKRREELRRKVTAIIPDFVPPPFGHKLGHP